MKRFYCYIFCSVFGVAGFTQKLDVTNLRCEYRQNPIGVDATKPRFSWELKSGQQNVMQVAYRILVADNIQSLNKGIGNCWDSKKVLSKTSIQVEYAGKS